MSIYSIFSLFGCLSWFIYKHKAMIFIIMALSMLSALSGAHRLFNTCSYDLGTYSSNSPFENNRNHLLNSLATNLTTSLPGFLNTSIGDSPDSVYAQALCRGDIDYLACQDCIRNASQEILTACNTKDASIWYEHCQVRYSFQMPSSTMVYAGKFPKDNDQKKNVNPNLFKPVLDNLMRRVSYETAFDTSNRMFATGENNFSKNKTIYGLSQCTRDMSQDLCYNCLESALGDLWTCCFSQEGGIVVSRNCNVRFEVYQFYTSTSRGDKWKTWEVSLVVCASIFLLAIVIRGCAAYLWRRKGLQRDDQSQHALLHDSASSRVVTITQEGKLLSSEELQFMDLNTVRVATDDFADSNKLGQGGFGTVYRCVLRDGKEVAVKRLSRKSWQGLVELKNEVILVAKLQHRNLVRLLGCCIEGDEKLLLYEFMPNRSLDFFIFDSERQSQIDWMTYYSIICGIARGLLYLHEDSRHKIIHRDLKPNNVLLDHEMIAKISDFGMARIFCENQNIANTKRVVGTYGYMAPEYAMGGQFSIKSDVFSFGVILLDIISGKKNSGFYLTERAQTLLAYVWTLWTGGKALECVDPLLIGSCHIEEAVRCIHIGLLCVQEDPVERPTMSDVVVLLGNESLSLPQPRQPAIAVSRLVPVDRSTTNPSVNGLSVSAVTPR